MSSAPRLSTRPRYLQIWLARKLVLLLPLAGILCPGQAALAQDGRLLVESLPGLGSPFDDQLRVGQLLGQYESGGYLIRSTHTLAPADSIGGLRFKLYLPTISSVWNSALPFSFNDGLVWAGRGWTTGVRGGVGIEWGRLFAELVPELIHHQNANFQTIPYPDDERSPFASPFHTFPESLDLPLRFGDEPFIRIGPGQSRVGIRFAGLEGGLSSANEWWGPGIRNAIVLSSHAPGIPRLFIRIREPVDLGLGRLAGSWFGGTLRESAYFDTIPDNDTRGIAGIALAFTPAGVPNLTLGGARVVYAPEGILFPFPVRLFEVFHKVGRPNDVPATKHKREERADQILSLFARWILPKSGAEVYAEYARNERPKSPGDFLRRPGHASGYTLGGQWLRPLRGGSMVRLQAEITYLEQNDDIFGRRAVPFYTSRPVPQGYTHQGQVIGAAIGPGGSSQWLAADLLGRAWRAGVFAGRIRWENDKLYLNPGFRFFFNHDVTVFGGVNSTVEFGGWNVAFRWTRGTRLNYLFQNEPPGFDGLQAVDITNHTLGISVSRALD
ncbi:MAG: hypothetical protein ACREKN_03095 [Longimicrobiaceae bacterium]